MKNVIVLESRLGLRIVTILAHLYSQFIFHFRGSAYLINEYHFNNRYYNNRYYLGEDALAIQLFCNLSVPMSMII